MYTSPLCSKDEREYEAKAAERQEEQRRGEQKLKEAAIQQAVSGASGQVKKGCYVSLNGAQTIGKASPLGIEW